MGLNIYIYETDGMRDEKGFLNKFTDVSCFYDWDSSKFVGDNESAIGIDFMLLWDCPGDVLSENNFSDYVFYKIKDFNQAEDWVKQNVVEPNQSRWFDIFDKMKINPNLYFYYCY